LAGLFCFSKAFSESSFIATTVARAVAHVSYRDINVHLNAVEM
jgi:hypothetical protein